PIPTAQTIGGTGGTLDWVVGVGESSTSQNAFHKLHVYVLREPDTVVGTLLTNYEEPNATNERAASSSAEGKGPAGAAKAPLTSVAAQAGDRLVIAFGCARHSNRNNDDRDYHYRGDLHDLAGG